MNHPEARATLHTLQFIQLRMPRAVILENVLGIADKQASEKSSPLDYVMKELRSFGYNVIQFSLNTAAWVNCARPRTVALARGVCQTKSLVLFGL